MIYPKKKQTPEAIAEHYNSLDRYYRKIWGEHLHHGLWKTGRESVEIATEQLVELIAELSNVKEGNRILDVGCGYGATSRLLARKWRGLVTAVTLSDYQWKYARSKDPGSTNPRYILGDFFHNDFQHASFDIVLSIESSEHMVDKRGFFEEAFRLLRPGGYFVTCAWLSKENLRKWEIDYLLEPICREGCLPNIGSRSDYIDLMNGVGFKQIKTEDISQAVKKTWGICAKRMIQNFFIDRELRNYILNRNSTNRAFAKTLFRIWLAYETGSMVYGHLSCQKPR